MDMNERYYKHYCNVRNAQCKVDARPPLFNAGTFLRPTNLRIDNECSKQIISDNVLLLEKLNRIQRIEGEVQCYNKKLGVRKTKVPEIKKRLQRIEHENFILGQKLLCMKGTMNTRGNGNYKAQVTKHSIDQKDLFKKYRQHMPVEDVHILPQLLWPKIYLDLEIKDIRPLDRIVLALCTETVPHIVLHLVKKCKQGSIDVLKFKRIYPNLWIEGEIPMPEGIEKPKLFPEISPCIDHGQSGTLNLLERGAEDCYEFSLSFKPLKVLNGQSLAFGRVMEGQKVLNALQDYGTKNGKPKKEIVVRGCGLVK